MKLDNAELFAALEDEVEELYGFFFNSEAAAPWDTILYKVAEEGEFTLENFLRYLGFIQPVELEEYFFDFEFAIIARDAAAIKRSNRTNEFLKLEQSYRDLVNLLQISLTDLQAYTVFLEYLYNTGERGNFKIIVGLNSNGDWIGLSPIIGRLRDFRFWTSDKFSIKHTQPLGENTSNLVSQLKLLTDGLILPNELGDLTDSIAGCIVEVAETKELLIAKLLDSAAYMQTVDSKIGGNLGKLLQENLTDLRQYIIWGFFIYIIGKTEDGDWVGVWTKAVWT